MFFPYRFDTTYKALWWPFGVREGVDGVTITEDTLVATFGRSTIRTPLTNVVDAHVTRDYQWFKAIGMRLSFADDGLTLGTATHGGVCVHFKDKIRPVIGFKRHSALTVTVDDLDGLCNAINDSVGPG